MPNFFTVYEDKKILGAPEVSGESLEKWSLTKGVKPKYAALAPIFVEEGVKLGVRGDIAFCQSILETGWFWNNEGPFDVKPEQNNFAGLGATGGGVPGDSFPDARTGIIAQLQDLAIRCDVKIAKENILSAYARKVYGTLTSYHDTMWKQLAGQWAMDLTYWTQIQGIMASYNKWHDVNPDSGTTLPPPPNPTPVPIPSVLMRVTHAISIKGNKILDALAEYSPVDFTQFFLPVIDPSAPVTPPVKPPIPPTPPAPPATKFWKMEGVCIDIGHGKQPDGSFNTGALDADTQTTERSLNEIHVAACVARLKELGCPVTVQKAGLSLTERGKGAAGYDVFISSHHNWYYSKAQHTLAFLGTESTAADKRLGELITKAVSLALDDKTTPAVEVPDEGSRDEGYTVPNAARSTNVRACCLTEAYFIDHVSAHGHHQDWSARAGRATAEAIVAWLKETI